jgi:heptosyltransferase-2
MEYFVYLLYQAATGLVKCLPLKLVYRIGRLSGLIAWAVAPSYRKLVIRNLQIAFGSEKSAEEIGWLCRDHFATLGANLLSSVRIVAMTPEQIREIVTIEGEEEARRHLSENRGLILVVSHIGAWELIAQILPTLFTYSRGGLIYQRLGNQYIDAAVRADRGRLGLEALERQDGIREAAKILSEGGGIGLLVDQHAGDKGVWCPFFGRLASTSSLAATLAVRTDSVLLPAAVYTNGSAHWRMVFSPSIQRKDYEADVLTARINEVLEEQIRQSPTDWFWVHNRWKTPSPKFLLSSYKRGICFPPDFDRSKLKPFRILIRSSNWLGDAVMSVPALQAIRCGRPDAHVTVLTRAKLADFWRSVKGVDDVMAIDSGESVFSVARKIRDKFDVAILFPNSPRAALEAFSGGVPRRVGFRRRWRSMLINQIYREKKSEKQNRLQPPRHQAYHYLDLARFVGAEVPEVPEFERVAVQGDAGGKTRLGLCPGAEYGSAKRWMPERYAEVALTVAERGDCEWILFGTAADAALGAEIEEKLGKHCRNMIGKTSLAELISELAGCAMLLTNDTGTMHLAAYLGVPTVAIFGSTEPSLTGPIGEVHCVIRRHVECSPCFLRECPIDFRCMKGIESREVVEAVLRMLEKVRPGTRA